MIILGKWCSKCHKRKSLKDYPLYSGGRGRICKTCCGKIMRKERIK